MQLKKSIPVKYHLNLHKFLPNYPTKQDLLFDLIDKLSKGEKYRFSPSTLKQIYKDKIDEEDFKIKIKTAINELVEEKKISIDGNFFNIDEQIIKEFIEV